MEKGLMGNTKVREFGDGCVGVWVRLSIVGLK